MERFALIERIHAVELALTREQHAISAAELMRSRSHELGNQVQIVRLASIELERRATPEQAELIADMRLAADQAGIVLADMVNAARPPERNIVGPAFAPALRAAIERASSAVKPQIELRSELGDAVHTRASDEEIEAIVFAALLDGETADKITFALRERQISGKRWVELLRFDDRGVAEPEPGRFVRFLEAAVRPGGGEASLSAGRNGLELAIAFPIAAQSSSSS
jgi:hypothetical protein